MKTCCVTGHRAIDASRWRLAKEQVAAQIQVAIDDGFDEFLTGGVYELDMLFVELLISFKEGIPYIAITLALPFEEWATREAVQEVLPHVTGLYIASKQERQTNSMKRNMHLVNRSERIIAVYDGRTRGDTANTIRYAEACGKDVRLIIFEGKSGDS